MMPPSWLVPASDSAEFYTPERCHITELLNDVSSPQLSVARARVQPDVTTQLHALRGVSETYLLQSGSGTVEIDGRSHEVGVGDAVVIPAGAAQRISNTGSVDLTFLCICSPRFTTDCYVDLESGPG